MHSLSLDLFRGPGELATDGTLDNSRSSLGAGGFTILIDLDDAVRLGGILPGRSAVNDVEHQPCNLALGQADLDHGITLTDRDSVVLKSIEVNSDGKRNAKLISTSVPPAKGSRRLIDTSGQITLH